MPDDGKGGWSDQGPDADLRSFATGKRGFCGVPYDIGEFPEELHRAGQQQAAGAKEMPKEVTIPIGFAVEGLCFLHSMTHSSTGLDGAYEIQYADGRTADILLYGEENIRDWAANPGPFAREKGTRSAVAWTGSCKMFATIAVYHMLWVNPNPTVPVKAVRVLHPSDGKRADPDGPDGGRQ